MDQAQKIIETWLTETLSRHMYNSQELISRLAELGELITDRDAQHTIQLWRESISVGMQSAQKAQDYLFELWGSVNTANMSASI